MKTVALERLLLTTLADCGDAMLLEITLWRNVNAASPVGVPRADLISALRSLEERRQVVGVITDDGTKWKIAAAGRARLAEINL